MLKLIVNSAEADAATIPVRWCVDKETLDLLKKREAKNLHILIVVRTEGKNNEQRYLVPFEQMLQYVSFRAPGKNMIYAFIVWDIKGKPKKLWDTYLSKHKGSFRTDIFSPEYINSKETLGDDELLDGFMNDIRRLLGVYDKAKAVILVDKGFFAKEPPAWEKKWVNMFHKEAPVDQCEYRKRRVIAYSVYWIPAIGLSAAVVVLFILHYLISFSVVIFSLAFWGRKINPRGVFNPLDKSFEIEDVYSDAKEKGSIFGHVFAWPLCPIYLFVVALVWVLIGFFNQSRNLINSWIDVGFWVLFTLLCTYALILFVVGVNWVISLFTNQHFVKRIGRWIDKKFDAWLERLTKLETERRTEKAELKYTSLYDDLVCTGRPLQADVRALPAKHKTLKLKFQAFKVKVCRPFAS